MDELVPSEFYLSQNYPNPFNKKTTIKYCVPDKTLIKLTVFDSDMTIIDELENKVKEAGTYEVEYIASSLTCGSYFYRLEAKGFNKTKEMTLAE
ncbi:MAG: T9SS type A sorting domain-containing protein [Ignavibacteriaceae bacterium]|jgi:hypothetical protein|nr:T9SS type A sorting domain-containing protein [Ignavibacteriaceae bacterium]MCW8812090.1 T9SS type A sorting domain-containing protein [Chlorobium sp.]MCW8961649.1 T9SS type A sorting domain-containing protein [Ignavibacteriaceae bacterium]MCW9095990.1 T9SS type A sorting domain-containing protein [Ignavibacteriaceae bacterium]